MDQGSNKNHSPAYNFTPTVTKFCVMWEGLSLPHDTKFGNCRCKIVDSRSFHSWSLIHGLRWSGLIKVGPVQLPWITWQYLTKMEHQKSRIMWFIPIQSKLVSLAVNHSKTKQSANRLGCSVFTNGSSMQLFKYSHIATSCELVNIWLNDNMNL